MTSMESTDGVNQSSDSVRTPTSDILIMPLSIRCELAWRGNMTNYFLCHARSDILTRVFRSPLHLFLHGLPHCAQVPCRSLRRQGHSKVQGYSILKEKPGHTDTTHADFSHREIRMHLQRPKVNLKSSDSPSPNPLGCASSYRMYPALQTYVQPWQ